jgi:hypothetical protein
MDTVFDHKVYLINLSLNHTVWAYSSEGQERKPVAADEAIPLQAWTDP